MRPWTPARRSARLNPSIPRKGLELTRPPASLSMARPAAARTPRQGLETLTPTPIAQDVAPPGRALRERLDAQCEPAQ